ncbi:hypothetical protein NXZ27_16365 [Escherichia coli]|nr:hypothetical protein [Escherichia coli]
MLPSHPPVNHTGGKCPESVAHAIVAGVGTNIIEFLAQRGRKIRVIDSDIVKQGVTQVELVIKV